MAGLADIHWWRWLALPWRRWRVILRVEAGDEIPDRLPPKSAVLVGSPDHPKWIAFDCPCRTGHRVMVNLDSKRRPSWKATELDPLTLWPSVDAFTPGRRCHFILQDGHVKWV